MYSQNTSPDCVFTPMPCGELLEAADAAAAVILAHGRGHGPNSRVVGPLRHAIVGEAGMHSLSAQMPVLPSQDILAYTAVFPEAYICLQTAIDFLRQNIKVRRIYLLGYSMGARMTTAFLVRRRIPEVAGFIGIGMLRGGGKLLSTNINIRRLKVPVLDIYADSDPRDLLSAEKREKLAGEGYTQVRICGATHSFEGYEIPLRDEVITWLKIRNCIKGP